MALITPAHMTGLSELSAYCSSTVILLGWLIWKLAQLPILLIVMLAYK